MPVEVSYSSSRFGLWRIFFAGYLIYYGVALIPYVSLLYSSKGIIPLCHPNWNQVLPNFLCSAQGPFAAQALNLFSVLMGILLLLGRVRVPAVLCLILARALFLDRNVLTFSPEYGYVGWMLLAMSAIPTGENFVWKGKISDSWKMPPLIFWGAWLVYGVTYSFCGYGKWLSPSWKSGVALEMMLQKDFILLAPGTPLFEQMPGSILSFLTWITVYAQLFAFVMIWNRWTRLASWLVLTGMHLFALAVFDLVEVSLAMLLFHFFIAESWWLSINGSVRRTESKHL